VRDVCFVGGYVPRAMLVPKERYDLRFLESKMAVYTPDSPDCLVELAYDQVDALDVGGPGLVKSGGGFVGGGCSIAGAAEGMAIAAVLNAITSQVRIKTVIRIQGAGYELFMLNTMVEPDALRIELSRPLVAIREAQEARSAGRSADAGVTTAAMGTELHKLANLHERRLLSRDEFDQLKAKLIASIM
jgi:hypothetical protein